MAAGRLSGVVSHGPLGKKWVCQALLIAVLPVPFCHIGPFCKLPLPILAAIGWAIMIV